MPIFNQDIVGNATKLIVILDIVVIGYIIIYLLMYLLDLIKWGRKEAAIYFTKKHVKVILYLMAVSMIIQFSYLKTTSLSFDGYQCTDLSIRNNHKIFDAENAEAKERFLEIFNDRKIKRTLLGGGSFAVKDAIFVDFIVVKGIEAKSLHVIIKEDASWIYGFSNAYFFYKFNEDEQDLYEKVLDLSRSSQMQP